MTQLLAPLQKNLGVLKRRITTQGLRTTLIWLYARGLPTFTGVPILRYSQVTPQLYVGAQFNQRGKRKLEKLGFTGCVNLRIEKDDAAFGLDLTNYLYLPTIDDTAPSIEHLEQGVAFIRHIIHEGGKVYIHCGAGVGRAPSMAAAYLMAEGKTLDEALAMISKVRPFIYVNALQMDQLRKLEAQYRQPVEPQVERA